MIERGISATRIAEALRNQESITAAQGGASAATKSLSGKKLKVIFRQRGKHEYVIITAYYV